MAQKYVNVLLIEDSLEYAELVQQWLSAGDGDVLFTLNWTDSLAAGLNRLAQGSVDVVLLDLGLPDSDGQDTFQAVRLQTPGIPVIILSAADNQSTALSLVQKGAEDYLIKNACNAEVLRRALRFALARCQWHAPAHAQNGTRRGRLVGVMGSKGGVGATTIACTLASSLAQQPGQKVLLMDLDTIAGMVPFLMNIQPSNYILDAIRKMDQMDSSCWETIVTRWGPQDLSVLPLQMGDWEDAGLTPDAVGRLLAWCRSIYDWVIADMGRCRRFSLDLAGEMDEIYLIATTAIPALFEAKRAAGELLKSGLAGDRLRVILNEVGASHFTGKELQKVFGIPVHAQLPADPRELEDALVTRRMPRSHSAFGKEMTRLAQRLAGLSDPPERAPWRSLAQRLLKTKAADAGAQGAL